MNEHPEPHAGELIDDMFVCECWCDLCYDDEEGCICRDCGHNVDEGNE